MRQPSQHTLSQRLLTMALVPAALLAITVAALFMAWSVQSADQQMRERAIATVRFLAPAAEYSVISGNLETLHDLLSAALRQRDVVAGAVYDQEGNPLAESGRPQLADPAKILTAESSTVLGHLRDRLSVAAPVQITPMRIEDFPSGRNGNAGASKPLTIGWVYLEFTTSDHEGVKRDLVLATIMIAVIGLAMTALLVVGLARSVSAPIAELAEAVATMGAGKLDVSVAVDESTVEIGALQRGFNAMARAISEAHLSLQARIDEATAQLARQALEDPLTGLPNRRAFEQALEEAVTLSRRAKDRCVLCFIDLDRFKIINDTCGHAAGDTLLRAIASDIQLRVRAEDLICRIGGDEFALLLRGCELAEGKRIAEVIREAVAAYRFNWEGRMFSVGASIGLAPIVGGPETAADITVAADLACYRAKRGGRNQIAVHTPTDSENRNTADAVSTVDLFPDGIPFGRLYLNQQPIVSLKPERDVVPWSEILLRVSDRSGAIHPPASILSSLEHDIGGLDLDLWIAENVLTTLANLKDQPGCEPCLIGLNLGPASIQGCQKYLDQLARLLIQNEVSPQRIVLEFPAGMAARMPSEAGLLAELRKELGCRIAIERMDGFAVFLLRSLQPDFIKVSMKMLTETYGLEAGCNLAQALCGAGAALSIPAIASEVEDEHLYRQLATYGFEYAQGNAISPPSALENTIKHSRS